MDAQKKDKALKFLEKNNKPWKRTNVFSEMLDLLDIPHPPPEIEKYFHQKEIENELFMHLVNETHFKLDKDPVRHSNKILKNNTSKYSYTLRVLSPDWIYPNTTIKRGDSIYLIQNQQPILITKHITNNLWSWDQSVINWITRNELRFVTALMCAPSDYIIHFSFNAHDSIDIDANCFEWIPKDLHHIFIREYFEMKRRIWYCRPWAGNLILHDSKSYNYQNYSEQVKTFNLLYDAFKINDHLLLRTCNYFIKSMMHWKNPFIYAEEAIVNIFFCLEWCLHLIQKKYNYSNPKINLQLLENIFENEKWLWKDLFDFIKEAHEKRTTLVHAEPDWGADWSPWLTHEDFWDYFKICRHLLNFILINRHIQY